MRIKVLRFLSLAVFWLCAFGAINDARVERWGWCVVNLWLMLAHLRNYELLSQPPEKK